MLVAGNLTWFTVRLDTVLLEVQGQTAAPALSGLALASVALGGALALAPLPIRYLLGVLQAGLGVLAVVALLPAFADPEGRVAARVTEATGIDGDRSVREIVLAIETTPWPAVAMAAALLGALAGLLVLVTARRWPAPGRRYSAAPADEPKRSTGRASTEDEWDALTRGDDPT